MSRIFLSHSGADERQAVALKRWLADNGWDDVFLDTDPDRGLKAGERWQNALRRAADRCEAIVFVISPAWAKSKWCLAEFLLAKSLNKLIFGVVIEDVSPGELPPELTLEWQLCNLAGPGRMDVIHTTHREEQVDVEFLADGLGRLRRGLQSCGLSATFFPWPPPGDESRSPYRGLEPLDVRDAAVFFGRDAEILQALDKLRGMRAAGDEGLFVVLGASGAGKSSFLRAGVLPRLARDDRHFLPLPPVRPERHPLSGERGLAHALAGALRVSDPGVNPGNVKAALREGAESFAGMARSIVAFAQTRVSPDAGDASPPTLVLSVDQAEELFSADATEESHQFLELIGGVLRHDIIDVRANRRHIPLIVVFTIRSDRYEPLQTAPELADLKTVVFDGLRPMPAAQFKEVIVGPATRAALSGRRVQFAPDLVSRMLSDCTKGADTLPLLSLTLARLYTDYGSDGDLRLDEYERMGGIADVAQTEAESILAADPEVRAQQLDALHAAFIPWLATINADDDQPMRRIALLSDLPPASRPLVHALIEKRLLLTDSRNGETVVEVAHESLLRQWSTLVEWLRIEREDLKEADRLEQAVGAWRRSGRKADWLIEGERLAAEEVLAAKPAFRRRLEAGGDFLLASRQRQSVRQAEEERARRAELDAARQRQTAAEALASEQQRATQRAEADAVRLRRRGRQLLWVAAAAAAVAVAAVWFAWQANQQSMVARRNLTRATALRLNPEAREMLTGGRPGGAIVGLLTLLATYRIEADQLLGSLVEPVLVLERMQRIVDLKSQVLLAFSPDGTRVATTGQADNDHDVQLWDLKSGQRVGPLLRGHEDVVTTVAFSPDGTQLLSGSSDKTLRLWNAATGEAAGEPLRGHPFGVSHVAWSRDGTLASSDTVENVLRLWDARSGQPVGVIPMEGSLSTVQSLAFSPDGGRIAAAQFDHLVRIWDTRRRVPIGPALSGHTEPVASVAFSPDGTHLVSGGHDNMVWLWDVTSIPARGTQLRGHENWVTHVAYSPDGAYIVSAGLDGVRVWDARSGQALGPALRGYDRETTDAAFVRDGTGIVSAGQEAVLVWGASTDPPSGSWYAEQKRITSVAFSPDGTRIVSAGGDGTLRLWDASRGQPAGPPFGPRQDQVTSVAFSPDGTRLVSGGIDGTVRLWEATTGRPIGASMRGHDSNVNMVAFSPDGTRIASVDLDGALVVWNAKTGQPVGMPVRIVEAGLNSVAFSPDSTRLALGSLDGMVRRWSVETGQAIGEPMKGHDNAVMSVAFNQDGSRIVSADSDGTLRLWDARDGSQVGAPLRSRRGGTANTVAFSPDGARIVAGYQDGTIQFWDAANGRPIGPPVQGHGISVAGIAFNSKGTRVVSGSTDGSLKVWPAPDVWPDMLCAKLTRNLSRQEWREWIAPDIEYRLQCAGLPIPADPVAGQVR